jgi:hypothetical protein
LKKNNFEEAGQNKKLRKFGNWYKQKQSSFQSAYSFLTGPRGVIPPPPSFLCEEEEDGLDYYIS